MCRVCAVVCVCVCVCVSCRVLRYLRNCQDGSAVMTRLRKYVPAGHLAQNTEVAVCGASVRGVTEGAAVGRSERGSCCEEERREALLHEVPALGFTVNGDQVLVGGRGSR